jgi:hypothetical protein
MSVINDFLGGAVTGANLRDFKHAQNLFTNDNYALSPKYSFLFHVAFDINSELSRLPNLEKIQAGMMVKAVNLPKYTMDVKTYNAYNRPNYVQTKIKYEPVTITFHDDSADAVRDFWYDYMSHYYRDSDYNPSFYQQNTKYNTQQSEHWGYLPGKTVKGQGKVERLLNYVKIYSLHQKRFSEYILVNPVITSFQHGQHQQGQNEFLENSMTLEYETVLYNYGTFKFGGEPAGIMPDYDKQPSPLTPGGGGTTSLLGPGGVLDSASGISSQISGGNLLGAGLIAGQTFNKLKGQNLGAMAGAELKNIGMSILSGDSNALNRLALPKAGAANGTDSLIQSGD